MSEPGDSIITKLVSLEERWLAHLREHQQHERNHDVVHQTSKEAIQLATDNINKRLEGMNELRTQITSERGEFATRDMLDARFRFIEDKVDNRFKTLEASIKIVLDMVNEIQKREANLQGKFWALGALVIFVNVGVTLWARATGG